MSKHQPRCTLIPYFLCSPFQTTDGLLTRNATAKTLPQWLAQRSVAESQSSQMSDLQPKQIVPRLTHTQQPCPSATTTAPPTATPTLCGSRGIGLCSNKQYCIADPNNLGCSLIADCPGICVVLNGPACGGFGGFPCPAADQVCVDDPRDDCGGTGTADCGGICVRLDGSSSA